MEYINKPIKIEAVQFPYLIYNVDNPFNFSRGSQWLEKAILDTILYINDEESKKKGYWVLKCKTLSGEVDITPETYIIKGVNGEIYPCKPDIFEETYEPSNDWDFVDFRDEYYRDNLYSLMKACEWMDIGHTGDWFMELMYYLEDRGAYLDSIFPNEYPEDIVKRAKEDNIIGDERYLRSKIMEWSDTYTNGDISQLLTKLDGLLEG